MLHARLLVIDLAVIITVVVRAALVKTDDGIAVLGISAVIDAAECTLVTSHDAADGVVGVEDHTGVVAVGDRTVRGQIAD